MKKLLIVMVLFVVGISYSQQAFTRIDGKRGGVLLKIENWTPFSSDSMAQVYTKPVDVSDLDSVAVWVKSTSSDGSAKWQGALLGGFTSAYATSRVGADSLAITIDTTNVKLETMKYIGNALLRGANFLTLCVKGNAYLATVSATQNRADAIVNVYIFGRKRGYQERAN